MTSLNIFHYLFFIYTSLLFIRFFVTPSDSVAIIAANAVEAIPYFSAGLKGVARFSSYLQVDYLDSCYKRANHMRF